MTADVKQMVESCETCMMLSKRQQKEPIKPHDGGNSPVHKIAIDL